MNYIDKGVRYFILFLINHFFLGTHFYSTKRWLLNRIKNVTVGEGTAIVGPIVFYGSLQIGKHTFIGRDFNVEGNGQVIIGDQCDIAPHVCLITGSHIIGYNNRRAGKGFSGGITIQNGCWICANVSLLPNVNIGNGTVIGACSLVNKDVTDNCLFAGVPARLIKQLN